MTNELKELKSRQFFILQQIFAECIRRTHSYHMHRCRQSVLDTHHSSEKNFVDLEMKREKNMFEPLSPTSHQIYNAIILLANKRASDREKENEWQRNIYSNAYTQAMAYRIIGTEFFSHVMKIMR